MLSQSLDIVLNRVVIEIYPAYDFKKINND
ncbi:Uncharacterised protein [Mycobacteroides abscessus subsp. abscessus]|nr:Uncharacterised protein [Mycobacteroides abscessus subsp. abscessus]